MGFKVLGFRFWVLGFGFWSGGGGGEACTSQQNPKP